METMIAHRTGIPTRDSRETLQKRLFLSHITIYRQEQEIERLTLALAEATAKLTVYERIDATCEALGI